MNGVRKPYTALKKYIYLYNIIQLMLTSLLNTILSFIRSGEVSKHFKKIFGGLVRWLRRKNANH